MAVTISTETPMTSLFGTMKTRANEEGTTFPKEEANEMSPTSALREAPEEGATGLNSGDDYTQILQDLAPLTFPHWYEKYQ